MVYSGFELKPNLVFLGYTISREDDLVSAPPSFWLRAGHCSVLEEISFWEENFHLTVLKSTHATLGSCLDSAQTPVPGRRERKGIPGLVARLLWGPAAQQLGGGM